MSSAKESSPALEKTYPTVEFSSSLGNSQMNYTVSGIELEVMDSETKTGYSVVCSIQEVTKMTKTKVLIRDLTRFDKIR
jgi:hypothetical protein